MDEDFEFGDEDELDAYTHGDDKISWDGIDELARRYAEVQAIVDPEERLGAAKALVAELDS